MTQTIERFILMVDFFTSGAVPRDHKQLFINTRQPQTRGTGDGFNH